MYDDGYYFKNKYLRYMVDHKSFHIIYMNVSLEVVMNTS
jgi:hypothetical protein